MEISLLEREEYASLPHIGKGWLLLHRMLAKLDAIAHGTL